MNWTSVLYETQQRRFGAVHDTDGLASYVLWRYWWNNDWFRV